MKWGTEIIVFFIVVLIVSVLFSFYIVVRKESPVQYNFTPFPTVAPENLPNADIQNFRVCKTEIFPCSDQIECSKQCGPDYTCTTVLPGQNIHMNGITVQPGQWCLPSGAGSESSCGTYTGRAIWTDGPDCGDKDQCWRCECLYPSLFGDAENGCMVQRACIDPTIPDENQSTGNYLTGVVDGKTYTWNPNDKNFIPPNGLTPYAVNPDGTAVFTCQCNANSDDPNAVQYTRLPNDVYYCHAQPCDFAHQTKLWNPETMECECQAGTTIKSPIDGICRGTGTWCNGEFSTEFQRCTCSTNLSTLCSSDIYPRDGASPCQDRCNPVGSTCEDACEDQGGCFLEGTNCTYIPDPKTGINIDWSCSCPPKSHAMDPEKKYCKSGCQSDETAMQYTGQTCGQYCAQPGTRIAHITDADCDINWYTGTDSVKSCCSGSAHNTSCSWPKYSGHVVCN